MNYYIHTMNRVIEYIEQNITESISLRDISERFCLSEFHFSRLFRMITGSSVGIYLRQWGVKILLNALTVINELVYGY